MKLRYILAAIPFLVAPVPLDGIATVSISY